MWIVHECWHIIRCLYEGNHERLNVETSRHDELWTTRRRVMMERWHWNMTTVISDETSLWSCRLITNDERGSVTNRTWRRSLRTPRTTVTVGLTAMTYTATCHRERVHSTTAGLWRTYTPIIVHVNFDPGDHASSVDIGVWLNLSRPIFPEAEQNRRNKTYHSNPGTISNRWVQNVPWWSTENTRKLRKTIEQHTCVRLPQRAPHTPWHCIAIANDAETSVKHELNAMTIATTATSVRPLSVHRWNANHNSNPSPNLHPVFTDKGHFYT